MERLRVVSELHRLVRQWFHQRDFIEVRTNCLAFSPGFDAYAMPFRTEFTENSGPDRKPSLACCLSTSPEFEMKGLVASGLPRIYQITRAFRNGEHDASHLPEFDMLEWYRKDADFTGAMDDTEGLVSGCVPAAAGTDTVRSGNRSFSIARPFHRIRLPDIFFDRTGIDLKNYQETDAFLEKARSSGFGHIPDSATWDNIFFMIFLEKVEPELLAMDRPVLLYDHPVQVLSLARRKPGEPEFVERFECYAAGLELCNGYTELDDWDEHLRRFGLLADICRKRGLPEPSVPENLREFIRIGLGLCSGAALGMDRLAMIALSAGHIREAVPFDIFRKIPGR